MSRNSLHRPRRPRVVWDRPATGTRLFPCPFPPNAPLHFPHYKRCPKAHRLRLRSDQSLSLPVYVTGYGRSPDIVRLALSKGNCRIGAPLNGRSGSALGASKEPKYPGLRLRAITPLQDYTVVPLGDPLSPGDGSQSTAPTTPPSGRAQFPLTGLHRRSLRRGHATQRRHRSPRPHISVWPGTSGGRDCPTPRLPRVSSTSSQKHGAVAEPASMCNIRCGGQHPSVQASPSSCATVRDLPSPPTPQPPQSREKRTFPAKQSNLTPGSAHQSKLPHSYPPKGAAQQPIPQPLPPQLNNRRP